jgi:diaminohydroxyphosphoribosylaminopyrimidine deaminase/5-amino-6-(5-phosphoribosylamino)uracil reductase
MAREARSINDDAWMQRALELARKGEGRTRPNPPVGAVLVKSGRMLGEGYHRKAGGPHAEVDALKGLTLDKTRGATLYVTLEPCSTEGRTPPCTARILDAGISRVVVAVKDPNPAHCGRGLRQLRRQGIEVVTDVCAADGKELLAPFAKWITTGFPFVTLKMGMTLDGRIADVHGSSRWITGPAARREVRRLRQRSDAILVGSETVCLDNPSLTWSTSRSRNPLRVIVDSQGRISPSAKIFSDGQAENSLIFTTARCPESKLSQYEKTGARVISCGRGSLVNLSEMLRKLGKLGVLHVLCEGGGVLAEALVRDALVDRFEFFVAPVLLGGGGRPVLGGRGWKLKNNPELIFHEPRAVGHDIWITAIPKD